MRYDAMGAAALTPPAATMGGGGLCGTAGDYLRFAEMLRRRGELDGVRILAPGTVDLMASNHLPGGADLTAFGRPLFSETTFDGVGFGLGVSVTIDPVKAKVPGSVGDFGWGGAASTAFWVDPVQDMSVVFMTQLLPSGTLPVAQPAAPARPLVDHWDVTGRLDLLRATRPAAPVTASAPVRSSVDGQVEAFGRRPGGAASAETPPSERVFGRARRPVREDADRLLRPGDEAVGAEPGLTRCARAPWALDPAEGAPHPQAEQRSQLVVGVGQHVGVGRQRVVLLRPQPRPAEVREHAGAVLVGGRVGPGAVPHPAVEDEGRAGRPTPGTVSTAPSRGGSAGTRWDPGTSRVAPFSSVKSTSIHITFIVSGRSISRGV